MALYQFVRDGTRTSVHSPVRPNLDASIRLLGGRAFKRAIVGTVPNPPVFAFSLVIDNFHRRDAVCVVCGCCSVVEIPVVVERRLRHRIWFGVHVSHYGTVGLEPTLGDRALESRGMITGNIYARVVWHRVLVAVDVGDGGGWNVYGVCISFVVHSFVGSMSGQRRRRDKFGGHEQVCL
jgi:hypothetical protein